MLVIRTSLDVISDSFLPHGVSSEWWRGVSRYDCPMPTFLDRRTVTVQCPTA